MGGKSILNKIELAKDFMERAHEGQGRWDGTPYSTHPEKVVEILESLGITNEKTVCAAYLHDVVEDTTTSISDIENKFGEEVADIVNELTFAQGKSDEYYWLKCSELSYNARIIKVADILANITDKGKKSEHFIQKRMKAMIILLRRMPI